jgi:pyruvate kinase
MIKAGMSVARLNFSHGDYAEHTENIGFVRQAAAKTHRPINIIIDLPGTKMRVGKFDPIQLKKGEKVTLTTAKAQGTNKIPVEFKKFNQSVTKGMIVYLNDGFLQLRVEEVAGEDVICKVVVGGELLSHKGLNLPGAQVFVDAITKKDLEFVEFGLKNGVRSFGLSFVETAKDVQKVRDFAKDLGEDVFLIAKIERREAIANFDSILTAADGVMIARGDLGVEIPLEEVPIIQKKLIAKANAMGKPVIIATQMLESMTENVRPTRAEVNDVANAILDGGDAVMLSEETAMGQYPVETVATMAKIAVSTEYQRETGGIPNDEGWQVKRLVRSSDPSITDVISLSVVTAADELRVKHILSVTSNGGTARRISRFKPPCWILAFSYKKNTCGALAFSYGVYPFEVRKEDTNTENILRSIKEMHLVKKGDRVIMTERRLSTKMGETDSFAMATIA